MTHSTKEGSAWVNFIPAERFVFLLMHLVLNILLYLVMGIFFISTNIVSLSDFFKTYTPFILFVCFFFLSIRFLTSLLFGLKYEIRLKKKPPGDIIDWGSSLLYIMVLEILLGFVYSYAAPMVAGISFWPFASLVFFSFDLVLMFSVIITLIVPSGEAYVLLSIGLLFNLFCIAVVGFPLFPPLIAKLGAYLGKRKEKPQIQQKNENQD